MLRKIRFEELSDYTKCGMDLEIWSISKGGMNRARIDMCSDLVPIRASIRVTVKNTLDIGKIRC